MTDACRLWLPSGRPAEAAAAEVGVNDWSVRNRWRPRPGTKILMSLGRAATRLALLSAVLAAVPAVAITERRTFTCEDQSLKALRRFGKERGQCLIACEAARRAGDTSRICVDDADQLNPPMLDTATLACADAAAQRYVDKALEVCPLDVYPTCATYGTDPRAHALGEIRFRQALRRDDAGRERFVVRLAPR